MSAAKQERQHQGKFIVFEGLDGSGQTTQAGLLKLWYRKKAKQEAFYTKEPSGGPAGVLIRLILGKRVGSADIDEPYRPIDELTLALLFAADRVDHLKNEILPQLAMGSTVIGDRYYLSSFAYQTLGSNYEWVRQLNSQCRSPDLMIFLDVRPDACLKRMKLQRQHVELYDEVSKLQQVRSNYLKAIDDLRGEGERIEVINGNRPVMEVHAEVVDLVKKLNFQGKPLEPEALAAPLSMEELRALEINDYISMSMG